MPLSDLPALPRAATLAVVILGTGYHPEVWPEARWTEDARLMKEAGLSVVRVTDLAWSSLQPDAGHYEFRWLNRFLDVMLRNGMQVVLGIPLGVPPPWLAHKFPDVLPMDAEGNRRQPGTLHHRCFLSKHYLDHARNLTIRMTKDLWGHRAISGWQIDSRFAPTNCHCETCHRAFLEWLAKRHGNVGSLNQRWGTAAWGQLYDDFTQVPLPWARTGVSQSPRAHNPSLRLAFARFHAETAADFAREMVAIVRRFTTRQFITMKLAPLDGDLDCMDVAHVLDFASLDAMRPGASAPCALDVTRAWKNRSFWVIDQPLGSSPANELEPARVLPPGRTALEMVRAAARGAEGILLRRWRSLPGGVDQFTPGVLGHDGVLRAGYDAVRSVAGHLRKIARLLQGTRLQHRVALCRDPEQSLASSLQLHATGTGHDEVAGRLHHALNRLGIGCDVVTAIHDWKPYALVLFPPLVIVEESLATKIQDYVAQGGHAVFSVRTGIADSHHVAKLDALPTLLRPLLGIEVTGGAVIPASQSCRLRTSDGSNAEVRHWCECVVLKGAGLIASYEDGPFRGECAASVHTQGTGRAWYLGAVPSDDFLLKFTSEIATSLGMDTGELPEGVEVIRRYADKHEYRFVLNDSDQARRFPLPRPGRNALEDEPLESPVALPPFGFLVVELPR